MSEAPIWHGGDLGAARRLFSAAPEPWVDLSTGINPIAYPLPALPASLFAQLPSPEAKADLEAAAAEAYGAKTSAMVVAAPGTQILISILPYLRPRSKVAVVGPTFAEHAQAWRAAGHSVADVATIGEGHGADVVVLVNPNNPDGRLVKRQALADLGMRLGGQGGWLVVDEAFADFDPAETIVPHLPAAAIILRSFGKTYGLAGLRLGFAIAHTEMAERLRGALGPWAVTGPAMEAGRIALRDGAWRAAAARARSDDAARLDALLQRATGTPPVGTTLFRLVETPLASRLFAHFGERGIWTRRFREDPQRLRLGLPGSRDAWARVEKALDAFASREQPNNPEPAKSAR